MQAKQRRRTQERNVKRLRNGIIGSVAAVAVVVLAYGLLYSSGGTESGDIVEGRHYRLIEDPLRRRPEDPIVVIEFFSYGCVHCRNFEPLVADWQRDLPDDVRFERSPVSFNAAWTLFAQTYFALEAVGALEANHERLFRGIHENGRQFFSVGEIADFVDGRGVGRQAFLDAFNSREVRRRLAEQNGLQRRLAIATTPTMVVAGRYAVTMDAGRRQALKTVDYLIDLERGGPES